MVPILITAMIHPVMIGITLNMRVIMDVGRDGLIFKKVSHMAEQFPRDRWIRS